MENYLSKKTIDTIQDIIKYIKEKEEYKRYIKLRKMLSKDKKTLIEIEKLKEKQKEYIRSKKNKKIKKELDELEEQLENNIIYFEYNKCVNKLNEMISLITDEINQYFYEITNILK